MTPKELLRREERLRADRSVWHSHWDDLARVLLPRRVGFTERFVGGERLTNDVYDGTPMQAARGLANAIGGMLRPQGQRGFDMQVDDDALGTMDEVKEWLSDAEERLHDALQNPKARYAQATGEADLDLVVMGTAVIYVGESRKLDRLLFQTIHLKDAIPFFDEEGNPEGMFRRRRMTLRQAADRFGLDNLSRDAQKKHKRNADQTIEFVRAVVPRDEGVANALLARNMLWADAWIERDTAHIVEERGFQEFPFVVPRWDTSSGELYGRSPGMIALPDANTLQAMGETMLIAGQRAADPPLMAPNDGSFSAVNTFPGGLGYYDVETAQAIGGNPFFALDTGANIPLSREMQMDTREQIWSAFFRNVLNLPVNGPEMTATEVIQRKEEFIREIGPVFGRLETDYTGPMIERAFAIMLRAGAFEPIPEPLQGARVLFEYESPVKRVQEQIDAAAARLWVQEAASLAAVDPAAWARVNVDGYIKYTHEVARLPRILIKSDEEVEADMAARAQQQQQMAEMQAMREMAETADKGASAAQKAGLVEETV